MDRHPASSMLGVVDTVDDQLRDVFIGQPIQHLGALTSSRDEPCQPKLGEVLGHQCLRLADPLDEVPDRTLAVPERPQQADPGGLGEHPENLDREIDLILSRQRF